MNDDLNQGGLFADPSPAADGDAVLAAGGPSGVSGPARGTASPGSPGSYGGHGGHGGHGAHGPSDDYFHPGSTAPLAVRMRPRSLDEVVGQDHLLGPGAPLRRLVEGSGDASVILYGPPGTGKTTIASLVSSATGRRFRVLSALNAGVKDIRSVVKDAQRALVEGEQTVLFIDEVHRFSRTQQDALLAAVENRTVLLVAATTENPSFSVVGPLLSRSLLLQLKHLTAEDVKELIRRALADERGLGGRVRIDEDAVDAIATLAGGDARRGLTYLEAAANAVAEGGTITTEIVSRNVDKALVQYDRDGDQHYDVVSAFIKSIRGSDVNAAVHYLARMLDAGEDPRFIARRLVILASEDIGMADPTSLQIATAAMQAVSFLGMPEARITLAQATIHLATAPKSNAVIAAIDAALADVRAGKVGVVPAYLRDGHYAGAKRLGNAVGYQYPHDDPLGVVAQEYAPEPVRGRQYYRPTNHGAERGMAERLGAIDRILHGSGKGDRTKKGGEGQRQG